MGTFLFKSSGTTQASQAANQLVTTLPVVGIVTPLALGDADLLRTTTDLATQMGDNLRNLLQTNWGERLGLYDYGANLRPLLVDMVSTEDFDAQAVTRIKNAVQRWMPYIDLVSFLSAIDRTGRQTKGIAQAGITVSYDIPSLNVRGKALRVTLYAI
jgi:phage baseplate assembly protein W